MSRAVCGARHSILMSWRLVAGGEYMFWVRAVNCGDQEGEESQPLVVRPQG